MQSPERARIAVVEDDPIMGESLTRCLALEGYRTTWWRTGGQAVEGLKRQPADLVVCDIRLPDMSGEDVFQRALPELGCTPILFITAFGDIDQAVRLIRAGADDYLTKPFDMEKLLERLDELLRRRSVEHREITGILGRSEAMLRIEAMLRRVADVPSTVLFTGETGVGKEVAARLLHQLSGRSSEPFIAVNCAAIPHELIESELFGHERGAFTGAQARHLRYAERAREGVLFLDEVGDLPIPVQGKLLRLIQDRALTRIGGEETVPFRARIICATNSDLDARIAAGGFRKDLFYRINVIPIAIPPLRGREADIVPLLMHFVDQFNQQLGRDIRGYTTTAEAAALSYAWPGNVRELRNRVERAVALCGEPLIGIRDLFPETDISDPHVDYLAPLAEVRDVVERRHIQAALSRTGGRAKAAADLLGVSRSTLFEKLRKHGLKAIDPD